MVEQKDTNKVPTHHTSTGTELPTDTYPRPLRQHDSEDTAILTMTNWISKRTAPSHFEQLAHGKLICGAVDHARSPGRPSHRRTKS